jgi:hypothetical protein
MQQINLSPEELLALQDTRPLTQEEVCSCGQYLKDRYNTEVKRLEAELVEFGLRYQYSFFIGSYGSGRHLIVDDEDAEYYEMQRGEWVSSSQTC